MSASDGNCAVLERTADGYPVGRCWFAVDVSGKCPRHGDVREVQARFRSTGKLTDEKDLPPRTPSSGDADADGGGR